MDYENPGKSSGIPAHIEFQYETTTTKGSLEDFTLRVLKGLSRIALSQGYGRLRSTRGLTLSTTPQEIAKHTGEYDRSVFIYNSDTVGNNDVLISQSPNVNNGIPIKPGKDRIFLLVTNMELHAKANSGTPTIVIAEFTEIPL